MDFKFYSNQNMKIKKGPLNFKGPFMKNVINYIPLPVRSLYSISITAITIKM